MTYENSRAFYEAVCLIKEFESFSATPYLCPAGKWTIGFGQTHWRGKAVTKDTAAVSYEQAEAALVAELERLDRAMLVNATVRLTEGQHAALLDFAWNLGLASLLRSTLWRKLMARDVAGAGEELLRWNKARVGNRIKTLPGLTRRREREKALFEGKL